MPAPAQPPRDFRQHLEIETPEQVHLDYEIAGLGSRTLAVAADFAVILAIFAVTLIAMALSFGFQSRWAPVALVLFSSVVMLAYFALFEGLRHGQTPGKRWLGIRVIRDTGHGLSLPGASVRALLLPADLLFGLGALLILVHPRGKRLADLVAGTVVVRDHPVEAEPRAAAVVAPASDAGPPELSDQEFHALGRFVEREAMLPAEARRRLASQLAIRLRADRRTTADETEALRQLHREEEARRRGRLATRHGSAAERMAARQAPRWADFELQARRVARRGLDDLTAEELPVFAARYREVAADLARARTYAGRPALVQRLERLVATGHNALYRDERRTWGRVLRFVTHEGPAAIVQARREVALALLVFLVPFAGGYRLLSDQPDLARTVLPEVLLDRATAGTARQEAGLGYVRTPGEERPLLAAQLMANNIRVAFNSFAGGIFLGVGSLAILAFNGASLGAAAGHFASAGLAGYFWSFVAGHGVLEIFAICLSGAAGFTLGMAVIAPGRLSRAEALATAGRRAIRLIAMVVLLLVMAGIIEGMVSASAAPTSTRTAVTGGSALFLLALLAHGWRVGAVSVASHGCATDLTATAARLM